MFKFNIDESKTLIPLHITILAVSDTRTLENDDSGALLKSMIEESGHKVLDRQIVKDDVQAIRGVVEPWLADENIDVVITTGGTGFAKRDVTPEALEPLFDKRIDGFSVLFHQYSAAQIGTSTLQSRATAGLTRDTLVFCLPGSKGACRDGWQGVINYQLDSRHKPCNFIDNIPRLNVAPDHD
ncbi:molybdenum cofactor biosynthesis protein B [Maritalea mobilis]|uniref:Molybdenum cofactor biosynthesis protein B n=1 Tax=Maritalea mobilis TaxID=483324 RepID=A0A4R6VKE3_9HYPH|nr:molybdenum cofactor biosynthesis protein B [Maritalea mobilis]TDQ63915.1 molybdenum cofactor biosynthesis protein B [Maritalea mobilis]